jgi:hypothetical protein
VAEAVIGCAADRLSGAGDILFFQHSLGFKDEVAIAAL